MLRFPVIVSPLANLIVNGAVLPVSESVAVNVAEPMPLNVAGALFMANPDAPTLTGALVTVKVVLIVAAWAPPHISPAAISSAVARIMSFSSRSGYITQVPNTLGKSPSTRAMLARMGAPRSVDFRYSGVHCEFVIRRPAPGVVVLCITGTDVGELADAPMQGLDRCLDGAEPVHFFIDA